MSERLDACDLFIFYFGGINVFCLYVVFFFFLMRFFLSFFFLSFFPTPKRVSDWLPLVPPQANTFFVLLLLYCLKSSMSSSDGCLKTCCMLPIVSTISNSNRSTQDKVVLGFLLVPADGISRVLSLRRFCKWLELSFDSESVSLKKCYLLQPPLWAPYLHLICLRCTLFLFLPPLLYHFTPQGQLWLP